MKPEIETFDEELQNLLRNTDDTVGLVNRAGNNIAHETNLLNQLRNTIEKNADARHDLLEALSRPQRVPLSETRREQLASSITGQLPRMFEQERARQQPPPIHRPSDQYEPPYHTNGVPPSYSN